MSYVHGVIQHDPAVMRPTDYLYRVSLKCLVQNKAGEVLVVKEFGRTYWDLPGGGMDHGETIASAITRELQEEVNLNGSFTYKILTVEEPAHLAEHGFWQMRLVFAVFPDTFTFSPGIDADEVTFKNPQQFKDSSSKVEQCIYRYSELARSTTRT